MKTKGRKAWLITWEGPASEYNGRCKVVAVLPPQFREKRIMALLPALYCSEYNFTLCEKMGFCTPSKSDSFFMNPYTDINPEFCYGHPGEHLCARKVENLRCEENKEDWADSTLHWTELPKFVLKDVNPSAPLPEHPADLLVEVRSAREASYTHSIRAAVDDHKRRKDQHKGKTVEATANERQ